MFSALFEAFTSLFNVILTAILEGWTFLEGYEAGYDIGYNILGPAIVEWIQSIFAFLF